MSWPRRWGSVVFIVSGLAAGCGERAVVEERQAAPAEVEPAAVAVAAATAMPEAAVTVAAGTAMPEAPVSGEALYHEHCAGCHMADGGGVPGFQPAISGSPILTGDPVRLEIVIRAGSVALTERENPFGTEMPPFAYLADAEVKAIMAFMKERFGAGSDSAGL